MRAVRVGINSVLSAIQHIKMSPHLLKFTMFARLIHCNPLIFLGCRVSKNVTAFVIFELFILA